MSFVARNHPQQTAVRGALADVDDRATTWEVFNPLHERFRFTVDAAAAEHNAKLPRYWTIDDDGLAQSWAGERVWCNPPYSDIAPWVQKAWAEIGAELVVMLLPANRTEQGWWQDLIEPAQRAGRIRVEFLRGRLRFLRNGATAIKPNERPPVRMLPRHLGRLLGPQGRPLMSEHADEQERICQRCGSDFQLPLRFRGGWYCGGCRDEIRCLPLSACLSPLEPMTGKERQ
jgi:phage N-6-adenine-methyltransferase